MDEDGKPSALGARAAIAISLIVGANWYLPSLGSHKVPAGCGCIVKSGRDLPLAFSGYTLAAWLLTVFMLIWLLVVAGYVLRGKAYGVLIDNRNRISLSKLQMLGWTVLILSGVITVSATMLAGLQGTPNTLALSPQLLTLMGISLGTTAATPALLSVKKDVDKKAAPEDASWQDIVKGDDTSNAKVPDVSKIQNLLITLFVMGYYMFQLGNVLRFGGNLATPKPPETGNGCIGLPELKDSFVWLIGISHAGYLSYKVVDHAGAGATDVKTGVDGTTANAQGTPSVNDGALG